MSTSQEQLEARVRTTPGRPATAGPPSEDERARFVAMHQALTREIGGLEADLVEAEAAHAAAVQEIRDPDPLMVAVAEHETAQRRRREAADTKRRQRLELAERLFPFRYVAIEAQQQVYRDEMARREEEIAKAQQRLNALANEAVTLQASIGAAVAAIERASQRMDELDPREAVLALTIADCDPWTPPPDLAVRPREWHRVVTLARDERWARVRITIDAFGDVADARREA